MIRINDVEWSELEKHVLALHIIQEVFNRQSQAVEISEASESRIVLDLRVNLQPIQAERLLVSPLKGMLRPYTVEHDAKKRRVVVTRNAAEEKPKKSPGRPRKAPS